MFYVLVYNQNVRFQLLSFSPLINQLLFVDCQITAKGILKRLTQFKRLFKPHWMHVEQNIDFWLEQQQVPYLLCHHRADSC